ncbi:hypothetical protein Ahy_B05g075421 [Arachis hypogaea]|uniref:Uncharacterized protein n=1 Tax=Arachis hypogaea TaxID=3818 RepID=A0A444Z157_ARAHY|nr:hypothetical protein Ahy_B05g075421 [Arachis hypogaea]
MFGFVTFIDPQTAKIILDKGNPIMFVGLGNYADRIQYSMCYSPHHIDMDSEMNSIPRSCGNAKSLRRQLMEDVAVCPKFCVYFTPFSLLHEWNESFKRSFQFQLLTSRIFQKYRKKYRL